MKILFLVKFYQPFDRGGSEWSTHDLARLLVKKGHLVTILTPNYGARRHEIIEGIEILRIPFIKKLKNPKDQLTPFWTNNILWFIYSAYYCLLVAYKKSIDIIHVHSNEFTPAAVIASVVLKKPTVVTFRDYQALCNLGFCLWQKNLVCNLQEFIKSDFPFFYQNYYGQQKNLIKYTILLVAALRARFVQKIILFFAKKIDYKIAVSGKVARIFKINGIKATMIIHNPVIVDKKFFKSLSDNIVYVGKFSKGKGADLLFDQIPHILKEIPQAKFKLIGSGYLEKELKIRARKMHLGKKIHFSGHVNHQEALSEIKKAALVTVPSVWPEPLPRTAIEAILSGTPVIATDVGGSKEIVTDRVYGILCKPDGRSLKRAIIRGFTSKNSFKKNIIKDLAKLRKHFTEDVALRYRKVYQAAVTR